jgi:hypothetical protein
MPVKAHESDRRYSVSKRRRFQVDDSLSFRAVNSPVFRLASSMFGKSRILTQMPVKSGIGPLDIST